MDKDSLKEKIKGGIEHAKGSVERATGDLTDDDRMRGRGKIDETKGRIRESMADLKQSIKKGAENIKEGVERTIGKASRDPNE